jgi:hypothetical protein
MTGQQVNQVSEVAAVRGGLLAHIHLLCVLVVLRADVGFDCNLAANAATARAEHTLHLH